MAARTTHPVRLVGHEAEANRISIFLRSRRHCSKPSVRRMNGRRLGHAHGYLTSTPFDRGTEAVRFAFDLSEHDRDDLPLIERKLWLARPIGRSIRQIVEDGAED